MQNCCHVFFTIHGTTLANIHSLLILKVPVLVFVLRFEPRSAILLNYWYYNIRKKNRGKLLLSQTMSLPREPFLTMCYTISPFLVTNWGFMLIIILRKEIVTDYLRLSVIMTYLRQRNHQACLFIQSWSSPDQRELYHKVVLWWSGSLFHRSIKSIGQYNTKKEVAPSSQCCPQGYGIGKADKKVFMFWVINHFFYRPT